MQLPEKRTNRTVTTVAILLSLFMAAMEATVVATAMPTVVAELGGIELYGWVGSIYLLGSTVSMPLYGKLSDLYGRKPLKLAAITIFLLGSMASGMSQSMVMLIVFRGLQAFGAGGLQSIAFTVAGDIYSPQERARIQGIFGSVWALAGMSGPFLGGLLVKYLSWRWVFYVNVPVGLLAAALYIGAFHESIERRRVQLDLAGAALLSAAVVTLLLAASGIAATATAALTIALGAAFIAVERRAADPVLPLGLLGRRVIAMSFANALLIGSSMLAAVTYLPLYMQAITGASPTKAGSTLAPLMIGWPIASTFCGRILARLSYRSLIAVGWLSAAIGTTVLAIEVQGTANPIALYIAMALFGLGLGFVNTPLLLALQESVTWQQRGVATAGANFFRTIGGAISVGALGAVLAASLAGTADASTLSQIMSPEHGRELDPALLARVSAQLGSSLVIIFRVIAAMAVVALGASFFFPNLRLGQVEAEKAEESDAAAG